MSAGEIFGLILAAGASSRFGSLKQLHRLPNGKTLVRQTIDHLTQAGVKKILVVIGNRADDLRSHLQSDRVEIIENADWARGMGASIKAGIRALPKSCSAVLIVACDQVDLASDLLNKLIVQYQCKDDLIAAHYDETIGVPAIFGSAYFNELLKIDDHRGAKVVLKRYADRLQAISMPEASMDLDYPDPRY